MQLANTHANQSVKEIRDKVDTLFIKITDGIYKVDKDRSGTFTGQLYVTTQQVIDELNYNLDEKNEIDQLSLLHKN